MILTGIKLDGEIKESILFKNFERRVGSAPKPVNKAALKAYYEKYKSFILPSELAKFEALAKKYLY